MNFIRAFLRAFLEGLRGWSTTPRRGGVLCGPYWFDSEAPKQPFNNTHIDHFGAIRFIPVPPGHDCEPAEGSANLDERAGIAYVREADWPRMRSGIVKAIAPVAGEAKK